MFPTRNTADLAHSIYASENTVIQKFLYDYESI